MRNMNQGDLAVITIDVGPVQTGSVVEIGALWPAGRIITDGSGDKWVVLEDHYLFKSSAISPGSKGHAPVRFFIPLRGDFAPDRQKSQEVTA